MDWVAAFISTSFLVLGNNLPFYPCNFFQTLSLRKEKVWYFERPIRVGRPKYDSNLSTSFTPSLFFIHFLCLAPILLLKNTDDFSRFIHWLEAEAYNCKISIIVCTSSLLARQNNNESSAKRRCDMLGALQHTVTPCRLFSNSAFANNDVNPFAHRRNK